MKSSVHPTYTTTYRVGNWAEYDRALVRRGDVTLWLTPDAIATWAAAGVGRRSGPLQSSDLAIETALPLSLLFHGPLRQTEGVLTSIFGRLGVDRTAPDHTTRSRRGQHLALARRRARPGTRRPLIGASTGLAIVGAGEWAAATHGGRGRRGWRKLHLGVDGSRVIGACALTEPTADDAMTGISLVDEVDGHRTRVTADPADDTLACYGAAGARGVVPPTKTASLSRRGARSGARDRTIRRVKALGRRRWTKASGDHQHARVENAFFRYTSIVGDCLRARSSSGPRREAVLACHVLNRMTEFGRPVSYRIGRGRARRCAARRPARIRAPTPEPTADDAITGISLVDEVDGHLTRVTADPAYDTLAFYGAAGARGARVVVPPTKTASLSRRGARSGARDRTIRRVKALGRRRWTKASGDHQHARVENAFFRYTSIVGDCLRARSSSGPRREAVLACHVLNRMTEFGRPVSYRIGRGRARRCAARRPARIRAPTPRSPRAGPTEPMQFMSR